MKNTATKTEFVIVDSTDTRKGTAYIGCGGENVHCLESAKKFASEAEANRYAESLNGNGNWWYVEEITYPELEETQSI